ncbi:unnamed protein product [Penicillium olsonii]|nr:unnamed protein product [Penicillium olsonii]
MEKVDAYQPMSSDDKTASILRAFHTYLPENGRVNSLNHLDSLQINQQLHDHARSLIDGLVTPFISLRSTPSISPRLGMEDSIASVASESTGPIQIQDHLKVECLARDGNRCVVSGLFEEASVDRNSTEPITLTECVHIIPFSLASWHSRSENHAKDVIWTNLIRHFPTLETIRFTRENINDTANAMTMSFSLHRHFGRFDFSFEETSQLQKYRMKNHSPRMQMRLPRTVFFNWYDRRYDLPHPELLKVHAIIAQIFHASGAAEQIQKALYYLEGHCALAKDGSTDVSSILAATTLGVLASRGDNA